MNDLANAAVRSGTCDVGVQPMDRIDAELVGHQLVDEGQGLLRRSVVVAAGRADVVAIGAADAVPVMAIGDQDVIGSQHALDRRDPVRIGHPFHDVLDTVLGDRAQRFAGLGEQRGEPGRQGQAPDRGQVRPGGPGQVEPVGGGLRRGALVRQHAAGPLVGDLQTTEHTGDVPTGSAGVGESHPVERVAGHLVGHQDTGAPPVLEQAGGLSIAVRPTPRHVDAGDVVLRLGLQGIDVGVGQHVVRRSHERVQVLGGVAEGAEGLEGRHGVQGSMSAGVLGHEPETCR